MEMRKYIIEFHTDGTVTWNEYEEPKASRGEVFLEAKSWLDRKLHCMPWYGRKKHPGMSDEWYAGYAAACRDLWMENGC